MNAACNWLGTLTKENQELTKSDLNQPQGSWKNWPCMPDCKCSWPWEWVLDLRNEFLTLGKLVTHKISWESLRWIWTCSDRLRVCKLFWFKIKVHPWEIIRTGRGRGENHRYETEPGAAVHSPLALLWGYMLLNNQIPSLSFVHMHVPQILSISCLLPTEVLAWTESMTKFAFWPCLSYPHYLEEHTLQDLGRLPIRTGDSLVCVL